MKYTVRPTTKLQKDMYSKQAAGKILQDLNSSWLYDTGFGIVPPRR